MDNAIKFSQAGSVITVWVKEEILDDGRAFFAFYCKDQGVGMSEDFIAHAFDMFYRKVRQADPGMKVQDWGLRLRNSSWTGWMEVLN